MRVQRHVPEKTKLANASDATINPATSEDIDDVIASIVNVVSALANVEIKNDVGNPIPVSASSLPLPDGAATAAKQDTLQTTVASLFTPTQALHDVNLGISEVYVTQWYNTRELGGNISGSITSTQNSAVKGLRAEWSDLGTEGPSDPPQFPNNPNDAQTVIGGLTLPFKFAASATYVRFVYQNGAVAATVHGQITFSRTATQAPTAPLGSDLTDLNEALVTRANIGGRKDDGSYALAALTNDGHLRAAITDILSDILLRPLSTGRLIASKTVGVSASRVDSGLADRRSIAFKSVCADTEFIYLVESSGGVVTNAWTMFRGDSETMLSGPGVEWWAIASAAGQRLDVMELA